MTTMMMMNDVMTTCTATTRSTTATTTSSSSSENMDDNKNDDKNISQHMSMRSRRVLINIGLLVSLSLFGMLGMTKIMNLASSNFTPGQIEVAYVKTLSVPQSSRSATNSRQQKPQQQQQKPQPRPRPRPQQQSRSKQKLMSTKESSPQHQYSSSKNVGGGGGGGVQQYELPPESPLISWRSHNNNNNNNNNMNDPIKYRALPLEFVHIPKTGGTSIEAAMAEVGFSWGFCKYMDRPTSLKQSLGAVACPQGRGVPPMGNLDAYRQRLKQQGRMDSFFQGAMPWHLPPWRFESLPWNLNMFQNATLFAVVRNPYDRIVSEYYFENFVYRLTNTKTKVPSATHLNEWALRILRERRNFVNCSKPWDLPQSNYGSHGGHWIPQYEFCYHPLTGEQRVKHILRFEHLEEEFPELMKLYNLSDTVRLPHLMTATGATGSTSTSTGTSSKTKASSSLAKKVTRNDLQDSIKQMIEHLFPQDFDVFGYPRESVGNQTIEKLWPAAMMDNDEIVVRAQVALQNKMQRKQRNPTTGTGSTTRTGSTPPTTTTTTTAASQDRRPSTSTTGTSRTGTTTTGRRKPSTGTFPNTTKTLGRKPTSPR